MANKATRGANRGTGERRGRCSDYAVGGVCFCFCFCFCSLLHRVLQTTHYKLKQPISRIYFDFTLSLNIDDQNAMILKTRPFFISPLFVLMSTMHLMDGRVFDGGVNGHWKTAYNC